MKNIFDFATKELSQDAFLRWLFENYNEPRIKPIVLDFIETFTKGQRKCEPLSFSENEITNIVTYGQLDHVDVTICIYSKKYSNCKVIVIEDKTKSEEHYQLDDYNKSIEKWMFNGQQLSEQDVYKVFYKTSEISDDEINRVNHADWVSFDIYAISTFFRKYSCNNIHPYIDDYCEHVEKIEESYLVVSTDSIEKWSSINWNTFWKTFIEEYFGSNKNVTSGFKNFNGKYSSLKLYFPMIGNKYLTYTALEIQTRDTLKFYFHPGFDVNGQEEWNYENYHKLSDYSNIENICYKELENLRNKIKKLDDLQFLPAYTSRSFAKTKRTIEYKDRDYTEFVSELRDFITDYINVMTIISKK